jgi:hypothetical protein
LKKEEQQTPVAEDEDLKTRKSRYTFELISSVWWITCSTSCHVACTSVNFSVYIFSIFAAWWPHYSVCRNFSTSPNDSGIFSVKAYLSPPLLGRFRRVSSSELTQWFVGLRWNERGGRWFVLMATLFVCFVRMFPFLDKRKTRGKLWYTWLIKHIKVPQNYLPFPPHSYTWLMMWKQSCEKKKIERWILQQTLVLAMSGYIR